MLKICSLPSAPIGDALQMESFPDGSVSAHWTTPRQIIVDAVERCRKERLFVPPSAAAHSHSGPIERSDLDWATSVFAKDETCRVMIFDSLRYALNLVQYEQDHGLSHDEAEFIRKNAEHTLAHLRFGLYTREGGTKAPGFMENINAYIADALFVAAREINMSDVGLFYGWYDPEVVKDEPHREKASLAAYTKYIDPKMLSRDFFNATMSRMNLNPDSERNVWTRGVDEKRCPVATVYDEYLEGAYTIGVGLALSMNGVFPEYGAMEKHFFDVFVQPAEERSDRAAAAYG